MADETTPQLTVAPVVVRFVTDNEPGAEQGVSVVKVDWVALLLSDAQILFTCQT